MRKLLLITALLLTACGGGDDEGSRFAQQKDVALALGFNQIEWNALAKALGPIAGIERIQLVSAGAGNADLNIWHTTTVYADGDSYWSSLSSQLEKTMIGLQGSIAPKLRQIRVFAQIKPDEKYSTVGVVNTTGKEIAATNWSDFGGTGVYRKLSVKVEPNAIPMTMMFCMAKTQFASQYKICRLS